jgi:hypothetical protein
MVVSLLLFQLIGYVMVAVQRFLRIGDLEKSGFSGEEMVSWCRNANSAPGFLLFLLTHCVPKG